MRIKMAALVLVCLVGVLVAADVPVGPGEKPAEKWEYAELNYSAILGKAAAWGKAGGPGRGGPGGAGGPGAAGGPGGVAVMPARALGTVNWVTDDGEVQANGWDDLATKLKMPALKDANAATQRVKVLNHLGRQGWELVASTTTSMTFKRRARK